MSGLKASSIRGPYPEDDREVSVQVILPEYCPGPFYWGWWIYRRERTDGSRNDDGGWGWLHWFQHLVPVYQLLKTMGVEDVPDFVDYPVSSMQKFAEWFAGKFPGGIKVKAVRQDRSSMDYRYELVEVLPAPKKKTKKKAKSKRRA